MKFQLELTIQTDEGTSTTEIITLEREHLCDDTLGLSLDEAKSLLAQLQQQIVAQQVDTFINVVKTCDCSQTHSLKGHHTIRYQTLFGKLQLSSPRFYTCGCQDSPHKSYSPLRQVLEEGIRICGSPLKRCSRKWSGSNGSCSMGMCIKHSILWIAFVNRLRFGTTRKINTAKRGKR